MIGTYLERLEELSVACLRTSNSNDGDWLGNSWIFGSCSIGSKQNRERAAERMARDVEPVVGMLLEKCSNVLKYNFGFALCPCAVSSLFRSVKVVLGGIFESKISSTGRQQCFQRRKSQTYRKIHGEYQSFCLNLGVQEDSATP